MTTTMRVELRCYRYLCPDCGTGDGELGYLATADEVHCMVCLIDEDRHVVLRRWFVEDDVAEHPAALEADEHRS